LRILIISDSYFIHTGFANQARRIANHLAENHTVGYLGWFAEYRNIQEYIPTKVVHYSTTKDYASGEKAIERMTPNGEVEFFHIENDVVKGVGPTPKEPNGRVVGHDKYAVASFDWICGDFKPDIVLTIGDIWMVEPYTRSRFRKSFTLCNYIPVDGGPWPAYTSQSANILDPAMNDSNWKQGLDKADKIIGYTHYGKKVINDLLEADRCVDVIPHGFDPTNLYPAKDKIATRREYFGRDTIKTISGVHPEVGDDDVVVGLISRNQPRKCHPALFEAFSKYANNNMWIYIHAGIKDCGWNLEDIANRFGIADRVIYNEAIQIGAGLPDSEMWMVYNSCTYTTLPAKGEGWGLSLLETMACGIPASASKYSGHGSDGGWAVGAFEPIAIKAYDCEPITGIMRAIVDIDDYVDSFKRMADSGRHAQLVKKGKNLSKNLTWDVVLPKWSTFIDKLKVENEAYPTREEQTQKEKETVHIGCAYPPDARPMLSVIMPVSMSNLPNYHQVILQSIRGIENQQYGPIELILVDNLAFGQPMTDMMTGIGHKVLRWPHKYHAAKVLNLAVQHTVGEYLFFTHSDVCMDPDALLHMMNATILQRDVGVVGGILITEDKKISSSGYARTEMDEVVNFRQEIKGTQVVEGVSDAAMLIKKEHFIEAGGFNEQYKIANHNIDLCLRLRDKGLLSYTCSAAHALHYGGMSHLYKPVSMILWDRKIFMDNHIVDKGAKVYNRI